MTRNSSLGRVAKPQRGSGSGYDGRRPWEVGPAAGPEGVHAEAALPVLTGGPGAGGAPPAPRRGGGGLRLRAVPDGAVLQPYRPAGDRSGGAVHGIDKLGASHP